LNISLIDKILDFLEENFIYLNFKNDFRLSNNVKRCVILILILLKNSNSQEDVFANNLNNQTVSDLKTKYEYFFIDNYQKLGLDIQNIDLSESTNSKEFDLKVDNLIYNYIIFSDSLRFLTSDGLIVFKKIFPNYLSFSFEFKNYSITQTLQNLQISLVKKICLNNNRLQISDELMIYLLNNHLILFLFDMQSQTKNEIFSVIYLILSEFKGLKMNEFILQNNFLNFLMDIFVENDQEVKQWIINIFYLIYVEEMFFNESPGQIYKENLSLINILEDVSNQFGSVYLKKIEQIINEAHNLILTSSNSK
jgi:hypothetical protein